MELVCWKQVAQHHVLVYCLQPVWMPSKLKASAIKDSTLSKSVQTLLPQHKPCCHDNTTQGHTLYINFQLR